jgi:hypothetical protein
LGTEEVPEDKSDQRQAAEEDADFGAVQRNEGCGEKRHDHVPPLPLGRNRRNRRLLATNVRMSGVTRWGLRCMSGFLLSGLESVRDDQVHAGHTILQAAWKH